MNLKHIITAVALIFATTLSSCIKDNKTEFDYKGNYIITVTPVASTGVADYILTTPDVNSGTTISTKGYGKEQDGTYRYYVTTNNKFFSMLYGQGNPGAVTAYGRVNGELTKITNFQSETVQAFEPVNDDLLLFKISRSIAAPLSTWYKINTNSLLVTSEGQVNTLELTGFGELAHFSWLKQVGDQVYAPYFTIASNRFFTNNDDIARIAVFNYADMSVAKTITDNRTSFIGRYFTDGLAVVENGDIYAFSASIATDKDGKISSTKPSAITRIKAGASAFDLSYYFNFEEATGGMNITNWLYLGKNNFLTFATTKDQKAAYASGVNLGIVNAVDKTYKPVTGLPNAADIKEITSTNYTPKDGKTAYIGLSLVDGTSYVYKIDAATQVATQGLKVDGGSITAIQFLN